MNRVSLFLAVASAVRRLPNVRGKVRALLALHRALGLDARHVPLETRLHRPTAYRVRLDLHCHHERMAFLMDGYEEDTVRFLARLYDPAGAFLDVGANIGLISVPFSLLARRRYPESSALPRPLTYCLEAVKANAAALTHHVSVNGCDGWIKPLCQAVGEREKTVDIQIEGNLRDNQGTGTANILSERSTYPCERIAMQVTTLDRLVESGQVSPNLSLIKIDTDGYDLFVLMGAARLLETSRPLIFGEFLSPCLAWHGQSIGDVLGFARQCRYRAFGKIGRTWRFGPVVRPETFERDLLLVPEERLAQVAWCLDRREHGDGF